MAMPPVDRVDPLAQNWELEFLNNNFNKIFDNKDWEKYCAVHIADRRLQLAMNKAQTCGIIEVGRYQEAVQAAKSQGMKQGVDFFVDSPSSHLVMGPLDRYMLYAEDRRKHLMILLSQARDQYLAKEQLHRMMESHALRTTKQAANAT